MEKMTALYQMSAINKIPAKEQKRNPFPVNCIKILSDKQIPDNNQKRGNGHPMVQQII